MPDRRMTLLFAALLLWQQASADLVPSRPHIRELALPAPRPHIVMALIDDLGWHDIGYHNDELRLPRLEELRRQGIELDRAYAYRFCSPSRSSLLSGRLPFHVNQWNMDGSALGGGAHVNMSLVSDKLRSAGYATHMVGKWHLGQSSADLLPSKRGFDTSLGYLNGKEDHWRQTRKGCGSNLVDLYGTDGPAFSLNGSAYGDQIYHDSALEIIEEHDVERPLFLYHAFQINHAPMQVPDKYLSIYPCDNPNCTTRQTYQAMTAMLDEIVGNVTSALKRRDMWDSTLFVVQSDNGGPSGTDADTANNYPLRGGKYSDFEGGVRTAAFVSGGFIPTDRRGTKLSGERAYIHIVDWYATFCSLAGVDGGDEGVDQMGHKLPGVDSLDMTDFLFGDAASPRLEVPLTVGRHQPGGSGGGLIVGRHKLLLGEQSPAIWNGPLYPNGTQPAPIEHDCGLGCLFDVIGDPSETNDLASTKPDLLAQITARFRDLELSAYQTPFVEGSMDCQSPRVRKMLNLGFWTPWTDDHAPPLAR